MKLYIDKHSRYGFLLFELNKDKRNPLLLFKAITYTNITYMTQDSVMRDTTNYTKDIKI